MGALSHLNIEQYLSKYKVDVFFETGTHRGNGVKEAQKHNFTKIISVEICSTQFEILKPQFINDDRVELINSDSLTAMEKILPLIDENILFWLDAHYPSADFGIKPYLTDEPNRIRLPLEEELLLIKKLRKGKKDIILMDDMWIYMNNGRDLQRYDLKPNENFSSDNFLQEI